MVIYLTGWGPVLSGAFAFLALENVARGGSRVWRITAFWSLVGITAGQVAILQGWAPSILSVSQANALALMGAFVLFFIIRMAGATMEQKEDAEATMRLSDGPDGGTTMNWSADVNISGTLASLGARLIEGTANKMIGQTFVCMKTKLEV